MVSRTKISRTKILCIEQKSHSGHCYGKGGKKGGWGLKEFFRWSQFQFKALVFVVMRLEVKI